MPNPKSGPLIWFQDKEQEPSKTALPSSILCYSLFLKAGQEVAPPEQGLEEPTASRTAQKGPLKLTV
jgi:hypothetical protein